MYVNNDYENMNYGQNNSSVNQNVYDSGENKNNKNKTTFIIVGVVGFVILIIVLLIVISGKAVGNQFSSAKANAFKMEVNALLNEAYMEKFANPNSDIDCYKLEYYKSSYMASCSISFKDGKNPTITIAGAGGYKGYCVYDGMLNDLDVVKCK